MFGKNNIWSKFHGYGPYGCILKLQWKTSPLDQTIAHLVDQLMFFGHFKVLILFSFCFDMFHAILKIDFGSTKYFKIFNFLL